MKHETEKRAYRLNETRYAYVITRNTETWYGMKLYYSHIGITYISTLYVQFQVCTHRSVNIYVYSNYIFLLQFRLAYVRRNRIYQENK